VPPELWRFDYLLCAPATGQIWLPAIPALVTLITVDAVVDIPGDVVVMEIIRVIAAMATGALKYRVVIRICMTRGAHPVRVAVAGRKLRVLRVIERGARPRCRVVAGLARRREELRLRRVARVRGVVVIGLVTTNAGCGQRRVIVIDVTIGTDSWRHGVRAGQRKRGVVVVEGGIRPYRRVVAELARGGEPCRCMGGIRRARVVFLVARVAQRAVQRIVVVHMAVGTLPWWHRVRARQREASGGVIKLAVRPLHGVMTLLARGGEAGVRHRRGRVVVVGLMTPDTSCRQSGVVIVGMAVRAGSRRHGMRSGQRERSVVVVEGRIRPEDRVVAQLACRRESRVRHGRGRIVEIRLMAGDAQRAIQRVVIVDVAVDALPWRHRVRPGQGEASGGVVERGVGPLHGVMALLARGREAGVWHRTGRVGEIVLVA